GDGQHDLVPHDGTPQMRVSVIFAGLVMPVRQTRWRQFLEPRLEVLDESAFPIVDVDAGGNVHRGDERHAVLDTASLDDGRDLVRNSDELLPLLRIEPEVIGEHGHWRWA